MTKSITIQRTCKKIIQNKVNCASKLMQICARMQIKLYYLNKMSI